MSSQRVYEGWMVRYGRRKIGTSFIHMRYFVLGPRLLCYYKKMPDDSQVPIKTMVIDGNCRVEDRGLKTQQGHMVYVFCVYSKKEKHHRITMAAFNIHEALIWKEKIELVIDQHQGSQVLNENKYVTFGYTSDTESQFSPHEDEEDEEDEEDKDEPRPNFSQQTIIRNGPLESLFGWTQESDSELSKRNTDNQAVSGKHWRLVQCHNGLRIFEELVEVNHLPGSCSRARKAVGIVKATCEEIFELIMSMDGTRFEWDCSFQYGSLVEEVDGHTAIFYQRLQLDWYPMFVWPRDLCYVRYWRRNDDGSYVVLFQSREHENCGPQPGYVRAHIESGGFNISPLTPRNGRPRTQVQHLMQIDLKGWGVGYISSFQQHCLLQMLTSVAGLREWFAQTNKRNAAPRIPEKGLREWFAQTNKRNAAPRIPEKREKLHVSLDPGEPTDQVNAENRNSVMMEEFSDEDEEFEIAEAEQEADTSGLESNIKRTALEEEPVDEIDLSCFSGNLWCDDRDNAHNCWRILDGNNYRVRSKHFCSDKTKIPAGKHLMHLVAVDWFKDTKRIDHVVRRQGCAAQVALEKGLFSLIINFQIPASTHYSMVFYFVMKELVLGSLLQRFVDGDDEFRNSRLKLIPSVPKGSWIVRQSVGSAPCSLGKVVDCNYIRGPKYLEIDVDIGSSAVANGVLGIVFGESTKLVVDMAILIQANTTDELPERLIGAVRVSHIDLSTAVAPELD